MNCPIAKPLPLFVAFFASIRYSLAYLDASHERIQIAGRVDRNVTKVGRVDESARNKHAPIHRVPGEAGLLHVLARGAVNGPIELVPSHAIHGHDVADAVLGACGREWTNILINFPCSGTKT